MTSPATRTLWLCDSWSSSVTVATTRGWRGSPISMIDVPR
jgi:hypothetical protein